MKGLTHAQCATRDREMVAAYKDGVTVESLMQTSGLKRQMVSVILKRAGCEVKKPKKIKPPKPPRQRKPTSDRDLKMSSMFRQGLTLAKIGQQFNVTRERVRQILAKQGIRAVEGGCAIRTQEERARESQDAEARSQLKYGFSRAQVAEYRKQGLVFAFRNQCNSAACRGIAFTLSFKQWLLIWEASGKLALRGRGDGKYVMSRIRDDGGYEIGNVHIQLGNENSREAVEKWRGKTKANRGVFHSYPGLERGWRANFKGKAIGYFASEQEAIAARAAALGA